MRFIFIEPETERINKKKAQPASYIRKEFTIDRPIEKVIAYMTGLGVYCPYLNGEALTSEKLLPGFTDYRRRLQYQEYDMAKLIRQGKNVIGAVLGDGWYRGNVGPNNKKYIFGEKLKFACNIEIRYADGTEETISTDTSWRASQNGPLRENDLKLLEAYDARKEFGGWTSPDAPFDDSEQNGWHDCGYTDYKGELLPAQGEAVTEHEAFTPQVLYTPDGNTVLNFGQNLSGHVEFTVTGKAGTTVSLVMGETLDEEGNFTLKNLQGEGKSAEVMPVGQRLNYTLKEGTQTYKSFFLISGYQYVKLENWPEDVKAKNFRSIAIYSNLKETGSFSCSNELINRFVKNVRWSQKSNFVDVPTDCPQRERVGWAGDIQLYLEAADYFTDTRKFIRKWLGDFINSQREDGSLPYIIPVVPTLGTGHSCAGWSDAIAVIPVLQHLFYGTKTDIEAVYGTVKRYIEYNRKRAKRNHICHLHRVQPHYRYILDTGFHYGEWLEPGSSNIKGAIKAMLKPDEEVATAWFYYTVRNFVYMAELLGEKKDVEEYTVLAENIRSAYRKEFLPGGRVNSTRQCKFIRPIYMGLANPDEIPGLAEQLNRLCVENNYRIGTGFLTTYRILQVLSDNGCADTAYRILEQEECPGWLYEVKKGATTVWEGWDAITPENGRLKPLSLNHYAPGAVISWLFSYCAGIRPIAPGFQKLEIRPIPGGTLRYAKAEFESVSGRIVSEWEIKDDLFSLEAVIPEGVDVAVILPDHTVYEHATSGHYECRI